MEFQKVLETRRTVRKYSAGVTREQMEELLRAAQEAPSWKIWAWSLPPCANRWRNK